ncbi:MAG: redoxin domain-containing protein [Chloroflexi bacterium]|nr:redoxin domain-containing protein [Chloroflexota bacterium]MCH8348956.1 redoxin domain-containing protein [Chloroflexota bacterium]MCI0781951.1 redoxin domain-containing protein [Chloroflexota bacterium]MCI0787211.1 redoxin domain-containing protein [Chloroflexota bacterium]MCI0794575.1 redoxin domain-containing protein [Chloroflexota bacterium]
MSGTFRFPALRLAPALLVVALALVAACTAPNAIVPKTGGNVGDQAPEFQGIANWINSERLTMEELRGKVVLIDFWTYTCVNCIRTMPYLKRWHDLYADKGLVIVGVHSPEFEFEKLTPNVVDSAKTFGLAYPIAQDNDFATWKAYSNRAWPAKYLVDKDGVVRYKHFGEGSYRETENKIWELLIAAGADVTDILVSTVPDPKFLPEARSRDRALRLTRELYGGYERNNTRSGLYIAHGDYYAGAERVLEYTDPGDHQNHSLYLQGTWFNGYEELRHARKTESFEDYIALRFSATSVNAVVNPGEGQPFEVQVTIDGRPLRPDEAGPDISFEQGRSVFKVDEGRMYEVVALPAYGSHELRLSSNSDDFALFAFTFGAYEEGP